LFDLGAKVFRPLFGGTALALGLAAYLADPIRGNCVSENRKWFLATASVLNLASPVFTLAVMKPYIKELKDAEARIHKGRVISLIS
jgi:hypothetical protein